MTATDELRRMLDERGVKWADLFDESMMHTVWNGAQCLFTEFPDGWTGMCMSKRCTPAQAIETTLGRGECRIEYRHGSWYCTGCGDMVGTIDPDSELCVCGNAVEEWSYCPWCGRKVVDG